MDFEFHGLTEEKPKHWLTSHTEVLDYLIRENPEARFFFDDGLHSQYRFAAPILEKYNKKGHFAIISSLPGTEGYMSWEEIKDLHNRGHRIVNHTHTHPDLRHLDNSFVKTEIERCSKEMSKRGITGSAGIIVPPYNSIDDRILHIIKKDLFAEPITGRKTVHSSVQP